MNQLVPLIIITLSIVGGFMYVLPNYNEVMDLREREAVLDEGIIKADQAEAIKQSLQEKLDAISDEQYSMLDRILPKKLDDIALANDLQGLASRYGISIGNISINTGNQSDDNTSSRFQNESISQDAPILQVSEIQEATVSFKVTTTYETFLKFIADLQDSLQLFDITLINFTNGDGEYSFNVDLKTYSLPIKTP